MMIPVIIPMRSSPPTHHGERRCYRDADGRAVTVSVYCRIGVATQIPFSHLPVDWQRDKKAEESDSPGPFAWYGFLILGLFMGGLFVLIMTILLGVVGWLPDWALSGTAWSCTEYKDPVLCGADTMMPYYVKFALVTALVGLLVAVLTKIVQIWRKS